ncbi:MAG TPA: tetratricopeptide repeat protein [Thermoanaerobaculia bacterium]|nr:tetratricopeptide repeat protein [Thermoanaerobaculia bacterium]
MLLPFFEPYAASHPDSAIAAFYLGRTYLELGQGDNSVSWLERAIALERGNSDLYRWLARAHGIAASGTNAVARTRHIHEARIALDKAVQYKPDNLRAREDLVRYHLSVPEHLGGGIERARLEAEAVRKFDPAGGRALLASIHLHQEDSASVERAEREYLAAIAETPADLRPRMGLGYLYQSLSRWPEAFEAFEEILRLEPEAWDAMYQLGRTAAFSGQRLDRAEEVLKRYLAHYHQGDGPPLSGAHFRLGTVYEKKGDLARAREHYQKSLDLDPANQEVRTALERLPAS